MTVNRWRAFPCSSYKEATSLYKDQNFPRDTVDFYPAAWFYEDYKSMFSHRSLKEIYEANSKKGS